jgi:hypothetical protein
VVVINLSQLFTGFYPALFNLKHSVLSEIALHAGGLFGNDDYCMIPFGVIPAKESKSLPTLHAGGLFGNDDYCMIPFGVIPAKESKSLPTLHAGGLFELKGTSSELEFPLILKSHGFAHGFTFFCGERGIRTLGTPKGSTVFETAPIDHSGISPIIKSSLLNRLQR